MAFFEIMRPPDGLKAFVEGKAFSLESRGETWEGGGVTVAVGVHDGRLAVDVTAEGVPLERVRLRWRASPPAGMRFLGDGWERAYGDLEWRGLVPERVMPWYFLAHAASEGGATHGYGVRTGGAERCAASHAGGFPSGFTEPFGRSRSPVCESGENDGRGAYEACPTVHRGRRAGPHGAC